MHTNFIASRRIICFVTYKMPLMNNTQRVKAYKKKIVTLLLLSVCSSRHRCIQTYESLLCEYASAHKLSFFPHKSRANKSPDEKLKMTTNHIEILRVATNRTNEKLHKTKFKSNYQHVMLIASLLK